MFCKPAALLVTHEFAVEKCRNRQAQGTVEQKLPRRADQQVTTAHNLGDLHRCVVHHAGQLIGRQIIGPPDDKIAKIFPRDKFLPSATAIGE